MEDVETLTVWIDPDVVDADILRAQRLFGGLGKRFCPQIKTHKIPDLARVQVEAGAAGIARQKVSETEVQKAAEFGDILLRHDLLSSENIPRAGLGRVWADHRCVRQCRGGGHSVGRNGG